MKKKMPKILLGALGIMFATTINAYAGQWVQNSTGWWYDNGNGTWPANSWQWIDGNNDGVAECYYFDMYGYMLANTTTPDGYTVDGNGAWTVNGVIQTRSSTGTPVNNSENEQQTSNATAVNLWDMEPVAEQFYSIKENIRTNQNALWSKAVNLTAQYKGTPGYAEYYVGGNYNSLSMTVAPGQEFDENTVYLLEIYGDNDTLLDSMEINYKTVPTDMNIDISGNQYIKLVCSIKDGYWFNNVLLNNAQFR